MYLPAKSDVAEGTLRTANNESLPSRVTRAFHPFLVPPVSFVNNAQSHGITGCFQFVSIIIQSVIIKI